MEEAQATAPTPEVQEAVTVDTPSVEDLAAHDYQMLLPQFYEKIEELSNRQLKRVVVALMEHPFEDHRKTFSYAQEHELFVMGAKINDCKFVMMKAVMDMNKDEIQKLLAETEPKAEENKGEVSNG